MASRDWDAEAYHLVSAPQEQMGREVLARLPLAGDETVLDAGCGTGRVTALLADRLPRGRVIAVDSSPDMVAAARRHLGDGADVREADLLDLQLDEQVDAIFSTATFHWIADHERLFARLYEALLPGGWLVAQCGGAGNIAGVLAAAADVSDREPYRPWLEGFGRPTLFPTPGETAARLAEAGFTTVRCGLTRRPVVPDDPVLYVRTVNCGPHIQRLPEELRDQFCRDVVSRLGDPPVIDYVRLDIDARRPAPTA